jgi:hypothetical protein
LPIRCALKAAGFSRIRATYPEATGRSHTYLRRVPY